MGQKLNGDPIRNSERQSEGLSKELNNNVLILIIDNLQSTVAILDDLQEKILILVLIGIVASFIGKEHKLIWLWLLSFFSDHQ